MPIILNTVGRVAAPSAASRKLRRFGPGYCREAEKCCIAQFSLDAWVATAYFLIVQCSNSLAETSRGKDQVPTMGLFL